MADELQNEEVEVCHLTGLPHGHVDDNGEKIVCEQDEDGNCVGWHKEGG